MEGFMEDILVSSRISRAKKEAGVGVLKELGVTTSDLINSAFDFVIETHRFSLTLRLPAAPRICFPANLRYPTNPC